MGWELVQDGKKVKCWLNLDEIRKTCKGYDWKNSVGKKIGARYKWKNDEVEEKWFVIKDYINCYLTLVDENNNNELFKINVSHLCRGGLGKMFDKFTNKFKYSIGEVVKDLVIINREYRKDKKGYNIKYYQYQCEKCRNIDWICEYSLNDGTGCNVCCNYSQKVLKGVNDIATTNPELCKYFVNQDDIYTHTIGSSKKKYY